MLERPRIAVWLATAGVLLGSGDARSSPEMRVVYPGPQDLWMGGEDILVFQIDGDDVNVDALRPEIKGVPTAQSPLDLRACRKARLEKDSNVLQFVCPIAAPASLASKLLSFQLSDAKGTVLQTFQFATKHFAPSDVRVQAEGHERKVDVRIEAAPPVIEEILAHPGYIRGKLENPGNGRSIDLEAWDASQLEPPAEISILLAIDRSGSVRRAHLDKLLKAVQMAVSEIHERLHQKRLVLRVNVVNFAGEARSATNGFTPDLEEAYRSLRTGEAQVLRGGTDVLGAMEFSAKALVAESMRTTKSSRVAVLGIILSDFEQACSGCAMNIEEAIEELVRWQIPIHEVVLKGGRANVPDVAGATGGRRVALGNIESLLPASMVEALLGHQRITLAPQLTGLTTAQVNERWRQFEKSIANPYDQFDLWAEVPGQARIEIRHSGRLPARGASDEVLASLWDKNASVLKKLDALQSETMNDLMHDPATVESGRMAKLARRLWKGFADTVDAHLREVFRLHEVHVRSLPEGAEKSAEGERLARREELAERLNRLLERWVLLSTMMKEAYGDGRYDMFQTWTFHRLAEAFTFQFLWSVRGNEHSQEMVALLHSMDAAGFHVLWADAQQPFAQALVNVQRYLDHQIVAALLAEDPQLGTRLDEGFRYRGLWQQANTLLAHVPREARASIADLEAHREEVRSFLVRARDAQGKVGGPQVSRTP